jgi:purine-binding chemotaxis protein CheW
LAGPGESIRDRGDGDRRIALGQLIGDGGSLAASGDERADEPTVSLVVFAIGDQRYAVPLGLAERVLPMVAVSPLPAAPEIALGAVNAHGRLLAVLDVQRRLGLPQREFGPSARLLVATTSTRTVALPVDEVYGVREVPAGEIVSSEAVLPGLGLVAGIAVLDDGLALIHDLDAFLSVDEERALRGAMEAVGR